MSQLAITAASHLVDAAIVASIKRLGYSQN
jgi:hypothetical protein